ncbi:methyl-accepting chemotaxis protein [Paenibacillus roseipurpureus]|uniref:Methyl-accepting chemotaxis protein n=1 Tax=Paenibacillus roseopurpureus TaxID=2918901 RepID=A0AA96LRR6_9BACL|nr:methyl-accepting chemotaxis protein [Paenibacillus sp. MBLB1832]WNR44859.1 methyl-accepting chemotaxis protein [Paenibacillus sp. MBLB1832]
MRSLKTVLVLILASMTVLMFVGQSMFGFVQFKSQVLKDAEQKLLLQTNKQADQLYAMLERSSKLGEGLAYSISQSSIQDIKKNEEITKQFVAADPLIVGGGFWMEPNKFDPKAKLFARYAYKDKQGIVFDDQYSTGTFDYLKEEWYKNGFLGKQNVWSSPYKDAVTGVAMITVTGMIKKSNEVIGVTTIDVGLEELQKLVTSMKIGEQGHAFMLAADGAYIAHPVKEKTMDIKISDDPDEHVRSIGDQIIHADAASFIQTNYAGEEAYVAYAPVGDTGMKIVAVMDYSELMHPINHYLQTSILVFLGAIALFIALMYWFIHKYVSLPITKLRNEINRLVEKGGDLTQSIAISSRNEIGDLAASFNQFIANLRGIVANVVSYANQVDHIASSSAKSATEVGQASDQVVFIAENIATGTSSQAVTVMGILDKMTRTQEQVNETKREMERSVELAKQSASVATSGGQAMQEAAHEVDQIVGVTNETMSAIRKLEESSHQIGEFVTAIEGITATTNLLALNASIEAARAGEHGRGFGVVAGEIRKLAEQSNTATSQIAALVHVIQQETQASVRMMELSSTAVTSLTQKAEQGNLSLQKIQVHVDDTEVSITHLLQTIDMVLGNSKHVLTAIEEASATSQEMTASTQEVSAFIQEQHASIDLLSNNLKEMSGIAVLLRNEVSKFVV